MTRRPDERPPRDYPEDFDIDDAKRFAFDALEGRNPTFHIHNEKKRDPLTLSIALFAVIAQVGLWVWWGGRMSQRVEQLENQQQEMMRLFSAINERDNRQDVTQGIVGQQYGDIGRRLEQIERKVDRWR